jgi:1,4-alpha-glucan branching enzyme
MGAELAAPTEWNHDASLDWRLLDDPAHRQVQLLVGELNRLYRTEPALHQRDCEPAGFEWIIVDDAEHSVLVFERVAADDARVIVALNFTPVPRHNVRVGVLAPGWWDEILNTDGVEVGGSGQGNLGGVEATPVRAHGRELSINLTLPPLAAVYLRRRPPPGGAR